MTDPAAILARGKRALATLRRGTCWQSWMDVGHALRELRTQALAESGANDVASHKYKLVVARLLAEHKMDVLQKSTRCVLLKCVDDLDAVEQFRKGLDDRERMRLSHPDAIWRAFKHRDRPPAKPKTKPAPADDLFAAILAGIEARWGSGDMYVIARSAWASAKGFLHPSKPTPRQRQEIAESGHRSTRSQRHAARPETNIHAAA